MKNKLILLLSIFALLSCSDDQDDKLKNVLVSKWQLIGVLADPG